jgi:ketosteroid isomerase-like protein
VSAENVEIVRRGYAAYAEGGLEPMLEYLHPEIEWHTPEEDVQRKEPYLGRDGVREFFRLFEDEMVDLKIEVEEILDGGDCVLALVTTRAKGRASGVPVEINDSHLWTHDEDGLATTYRDFLDRDKALAAAGLEPR